MLGVSGTPVLDAVGKLGDLGDHLSDKHTLLDSDSWTDDPTGRAVGWMRLLYVLSTTIRSDGDYPSEGIPLRLHPTIRFGMAVDAIKRLGNHLHDYCTPCVLSYVVLYAWWRPDWRFGLAL